MLLFAQIVVNYKQMFRKIITYISGDNVLHCIGVNLLFGRHYILYYLQFRTIIKTNGAKQGQFLLKK